MKPNKVAGLFLLLVIVTLTKCQDDAVLNQAVGYGKNDVQGVSCRGNSAVCLGPFSYKRCSFDGKTNTFATGSVRLCPPMTRCINDGIEICVALKPVSPFSKYGPVGPSSSPYVVSIDSPVRSSAEPIYFGPTMESLPSASSTTFSDAVVSLLNRTSPKADMTLPPLKLAIVALGTTLPPVESTTLAPFLTTMSNDPETTTASVETTMTSFESTIPFSVESTSEAFESNNGPNETTPVPLEAILGAVGSTVLPNDKTVASMAETVQAVKPTASVIESIEGTATTALPFETTILPAETTALPLDPTVLSDDTTALPAGTTILPVEVAALPVGTTILPDETTVPSVDTTIPPVEVAALPVETTILPDETTVLSVDTTISPVEVAALPVETTILPDEATDQPAYTTIPPVEVAALPVETTILPDEATDQPADTTIPPVEVAALPVETTILPDETTALPIGITTPSAEPTAIHVDTTIVPSRTTSLPVNMTILPAETPMNSQGTTATLAVGDDEPLSTVTDSVESVQPKSTTINPVDATLTEETTEVPIRNTTTYHSDSTPVASTNLMLAPDHVMVTATSTIPADLSTIAPNDVSTNEAPLDPTTSAANINASGQGNISIGLIDPTQQINPDVYSDISVDQRNNTPGNPSTSMDVDGASVTASNVKTNNSDAVGTNDSANPSEPIHIKAPVDSTSSLLKPAAPVEPNLSVHTSIPVHPNLSLDTSVPIHSNILVGIPVPAYSRVPVGSLSPVNPNESTAVNAGTDLNANGGFTTLQNVNHNSAPLSPKEPVDSSAQNVPANPQASAGVLKDAVNPNSTISSATGPKRPDSNHSDAAVIAASVNRQTIQKVNPKQDETTLGSQGYPVIDGMSTNYNRQFGNKGIMPAIYSVPFWTIDSSSSSKKDIRRVSSKTWSMPKIFGENSNDSVETESVETKTVETESAMTNEDLSKEKKKSKETDSENDDSHDDDDNAVNEYNSRERKRLVKKIISKIKEHSCKEDEVVGDIRDCKKYYRCAQDSGESKFKHMRCGNNQRFDSKSKACIHKRKAKCFNKKDLIEQISQTRQH